MALYKLLERGVLRTSDSAFIPPIQRNRDWEEYQRWLALGNTPDPADPPPAPIDLSDVDNLDRVIKTLVLCIAQVGGLTTQQAKALFMSKYRSLP